MDQEELEPRQDLDSLMYRDSPPTQLTQMKLWFLRCCRHPEIVYKQIRSGKPNPSIKVETSSQLTTSMSDERPTSWQKACNGAVRKKVNWLPLGVSSEEDINDGLSGERSKAAASPLSAPCITWIFNK